MAIIYDKVQRRNPMKPMLPKKWFATVKSVTQVSEKEVARQIADETTLNAKEAEFALQQLRKVLINNLKNGNTVKLGDWATFYVTINCEGVEEEKDFTPAKIKKINVQCRCDASFKEELAKAEFVPATKFAAKGKPATTEQQTENK